MSARRKSRSRSSISKSKSQSQTTESDFTEVEASESKVMVETTETPTRVSRVQERRELHTLNDRLQNFVLHNKAVEEENESLKEELAQLRKQLQEHVAEVQRQFKAETKSLRSTVQTFTAKNSGLDAENARLKAQVNSLTTKSSEVEMYRSKNHELTDRVRDLEEELERTKSDLNQANDEIQQLREIIAKHEHVISSREEQLSLAKNELETVKKTVTKEVNANRAELAERVEKKLTEAHQKWQQETQDRMTKLEYDLRQHFKRTTSELNDRSQSLVDQNRRLQKENDRLTHEVADTGGVTQELVSKLAQQDKRHKQELARMQRDYNSLEEELTKTAKARLDKEQDFNDLMDVKISLQTEIEKYRRILDLEEERFATSTPARKAAEARRAQGEQRTEKDTTVTVTKRSSKAVKRSRTVLDNEADTTALAAQPSKRKRARVSRKKKKKSLTTSKGVHKGNIRVSNVDLVADCVCVTNADPYPVSMKGWCLISETGTQRFDFPEDLVIEAGGKVTVWSGKNAESHHAPPEHLFWTRRYVWNNNGDTAILLDPNGEQVSIVREPGASAAAAAAAAAGSDDESTASGPSFASGSTAATGLNHGAAGEDGQGCTIM